ncbi:MAG: hypothetical protein JRJ19_10190 [Deltaproteobacteria bacterium]|nr:hypothetical protein [Deltaproteobacteria bacterium]MBW1872425.1 hypothetical protein [Deltaproteobacteria bacterium]
MKKPYIHYVIATILLICAGCASRQAGPAVAQEVQPANTPGDKPSQKEQGSIKRQAGPTTTVQAVLTDYAPHDMHSQMEEGPDEWHDGARFKIEHPEKLKGRTFSVYFPSEADNSPFRAEVGTRYEFRIEEKLLEPDSSTHIFNGALHELKELKDNPK